MYVAVNLMSAIIHSQSNYGTVIIFDGVNYIFYSFASNLCTAIFRNHPLEITERRTRRLSPVDKRHEGFLVTRHYTSSFKAVCNRIFTSM